MKLAKLSLAAIMAAGVFSVANATPLEDAIKGVDLSGMLRLRFYNEDANNDATDRSEAYNRYRSSADFKFTIPVDDSFKFIYKLGVETNAYSNGNSDVTGTLTKGGTVTENFAYLNYASNGLNVIAGRLPVQTTITQAGHGENVGSGLIATYGVGGGFTLAGAFIDDLEGNSALKNVGLTNIGADVVALAAIYGSDMVDAQLWYYNVSNVLDYVTTLSVDVKPMAGVKVHGEYASSKMDDAASTAVGFNKRDTKQFYNINVSYAANGFSVLGGYAGTNKHDGVIFVNGDAPFAMTMPVANNYSIANQTDVDAWYAKVGYDVMAGVNVYAAYGSVDQGTVANTTADNEDYVDYTVGASYKYNKKLSFSTYYDVYNYDKKPDDALDKDNNEFRIEAKYTF